MTWGQQNSEAEAHEQLHYAWEQGINFLDTAEMYPVPTKAETQGRTEAYIGSWLKTRRRDEVVIATKVSGYSDQIDWLRKNGAPTRVSREQILEAVEGSLGRLQVDTIDLLQIHWPDRYVPLFGKATFSPSERRDAVPFEEQLEAFQHLIREGKVRHIGVSNETSYGVMMFIRSAEEAGLPRVQTIQNSYSLLNRVRYDTDLIEVCYETGVSLLAYSPLAGGGLSGKYVRGGAGASARFNMFPGYMARYNKSPARAATQEYVEVADKHGLTATQLALAWCQGRWEVSSTIIGATAMDQLKENIEAFDRELSEECLQDVERVFQRYQDPSALP